LKNNFRIKSTLKLVINTIQYNILVRKPESKRLFGRPRRRWDDNIRLDLREIG